MGHTIEDQLAGNASSEGVPDDELGILQRRNGNTNLMTQQNEQRLDSGGICCNAHHTAILEDHELVMLLVPTVCHVNLSIDAVMKPLRGIARIFGRRVPLISMRAVRAIRVAYQHSAVEHAVLSASIRRLRILIGLAERIRKVRATAIKSCGKPLCLSRFPDAVRVQPLKLVKNEKMQHFTYHSTQRRDGQILA